jgi:hypothetical protein
MRKGFIFILLLLAAAGTAWLVHAEKEQGNVSQGSSLAQRELIVNGTFTDGIQGWQIDTTGTKPNYQVLQTGGKPGRVLALTADNQNVTYLRQRVGTQTPFLRLQYKANFLSTRGNGYIKLTAYDEGNQPLAVLGWVAEGDIPSLRGNEKWYDLRVPRNTLGNWLEQDILVVEKLKQEFPLLDYKKIREYQIDFIVSDGQHGLFTDVRLLEQNWAELRLQVINNTLHQDMGQDFTIATRITNTGNDAKQDVLVRALEPPGWGLVVKEPVQKIDIIGPGETKVINWVVTAQRPSTVNLGNPWEIVFQIEGTQSEKTAVLVEDPRPGKVYYVLTDDLEPIDGAGYVKAYGNQNAWLDPEEFQIQLVQKAERLNMLANTYGAKWSHYIAWPAVTGAQWAAGQSKTGAWPMAIKALEQSVHTQSAQGHEYAVHMHSDYDPRFPNAILRYDSATDGFWANHRRHGWAQNLPELGTPAEIATRTGSLYYYHSRLTELMRGSGQGQIIATRVGSYDFGDFSADESKSIESYRRAGLMAGSDADGNRGGVTAADYTKNLYFTSDDDINKPAGDLGKIGILQFKPTPEQYIAYDADNADILNRKVTEGLAVHTQQGKIMAGVHAIVGFTHAMFIMGEGDWRALDGGQFSEIDRHLNYVQQNFIKQGLLDYATSSELAKAYWDYYTPKLTAVFGPEQRQGWGTFVYPIQLLGSQIPVDAGHVHSVTMKYPLYLRDKAYKIEVRKNGKVIMKTWGVPTPFNDIVFPVDDRTAAYTMHVQANEWTGKIVKMMRSLWQKIHFN